MKPVSAKNGDTNPQNFITFVLPIEGGAFETLFVWENKPTSQDVCNAIVLANLNPLLYTWETNSL